MSSTVQAGHNPTDEADEATPLLTSERPTDVEAQKDEPIPTRNWIQFWTNVHVLTTLSLTFCGLVLLAGLVHYIWTNILNNGYYYDYRIQDFMHQGTFICTWTAIISVLNYSRLRMNGSQLPWSFNLIVDFVVFISALFTSILFFLTIALQPCDSPYRHCPKLTHPVVIIGMIEMIFVLGLALTHLMLLVMRIRVPPQQGNSLFGGGGNNVSSSGSGNASAAGVGAGTGAPSSFSFSDGWFCGFGRGPLGVAIQSMPDNNRGASATQTHAVSS